MNLGFFNAAGLAYLATVAVLIYIYYRLRKKRRREISSLILWKNLREQIIRRRRFRPDFLFYLQLALLLLLSLAAARPYLRAEGKSENPQRHLILVLDRSASMQTEEGFRSRWERAREEARKTIRSLKRGDRVTLIGAGAAPAILFTGEIDFPRLEEIVRKTEATDATGRLGEALELAAAAAGKDRENGENSACELHVFTDRRNSGEGARSERVFFHRVGRDRPNAAITALEIYPDPFFPSRETPLYATVENFSRQSFHGTLSLLSGEKSLLHRRLELEPGESRTLRLNPERSRPAEKLVARLTPSDPLPLDNTAYAVVNDSAVRPLLLAPRGGRIVAQWEEISRAIPGLKLEVLRTDTSPASESGGYPVHVYYRGEPRGEVDGSLLLICPPMGNRFLRAADAWLAPARFIDWDDDHPAGKNLTGLDQVPLGGCRRFEPASWASPVVTAATAKGDVAAVLCGERGGRRTAIVGFDLAALDLKPSRNRPVLILLLNLLRWLCGGGGASIRTGELITPGTGSDPAESGGNRLSFEEPAVIDPQGKERRLSEASGNQSPFRAEQAGFYTLRDSGGETLLAANLFDREESNLLEAGLIEEIPSFDRDAFSRGREVPREEEKIFEGQGLFLSLFLALLAVEWSLFSLRRRKRPAGKERAE